MGGVKCCKGGGVGKDTRKEKKSTWGGSFFRKKNKEKK